MVTLEALSFVDKIWPLLEKRMESRVEEKLSSITTATFDCINKFFQSVDFKASLQESNGFDLADCSNKFRGTKKKWFKTYERRSNRS